MSGTDHARVALAGLAVGDCFGEQFFGEPEEVLIRLRARATTPAPWKRFAERMTPTRGYGRGAFEVLQAIREGQRWQHASRAAFRGLGSFGNGAAMRVAPLGAFFADKSPKVIAEQARLSAEVTHAHEEGVNGAIAVAIATATASRERHPSLGSEWIASVAKHVPRGYTRDGIEEARALPATATILEAARTLGNGSAVTSPDTVPLCLWIAAHHSADFRETMWTTVSALGDRDTTCAIVGGILATRLGLDAIPAEWRRARERVPWLDDPTRPA